MAALRSSVALYHGGVNRVGPAWGRVAEWSNAPVLKTGSRLRGTGVRIPPLPPHGAAEAEEYTRLRRTMREEHEQVLVVERELVESLGTFQGLKLNPAPYLAVLLDPRNYRFVPRHRAEHDEGLKQLIPYFIMYHGERIWSYTRGRQAGEERLIAKVSIGVGGHINQGDEDLFGDVYSRAAMRELEEEVILPPGYVQAVVALLNDDSTPVGRVHLGVIHVLRLACTAVRKREGVITEGGFRTLPELRKLRDRLETWSQICLDRMEELLAAAGAATEGNHGPAEP